MLTLRCVRLLIQQHWLGAVLRETGECHLGLAGAGVGVGVLCVSRAPRPPVWDGALGPHVLWSAPPELRGRGSELFTKSRFGMPSFKGHGQDFGSEFWHVFWCVCPGKQRGNGRRCPALAVPRPGPTPLERQTEGPREASQDQGQKTRRVARSEIRTRVTR